MPTALLSVWDKSGLVPFAKELEKRNWRLVASGGTEQALREAGLDVCAVSDLTGLPAMLGGRVKTLHPAIHAGLLARDTAEDRRTLEQHGWPMIDMVVVNLYPFEETVADPEVTLAQAIEKIDIGGVALLRAAAKNHHRVTVLCDPADYASALDVEDPQAFRLQMACKAFSRTAAYDSAIQRYLSQFAGEEPQLEMRFFPVQELRYGENPHQSARLYGEHAGDGPLGGELLHGKPLSFNNLLDLDAALRTVERFSEPAVAVMKHVSPCGVATSQDVSTALPLAIASDPVSAFGSVIACNREVDAAFVDALGKLFVECIVAPAFQTQALQALSKRKNLRLLCVPQRPSRARFEIRSIVGGLLQQQVDRGDPQDAPPWQVVSKRTPSQEQERALRFAWQAVQTVKSNAVLLARADGNGAYTVGIGGGQPNRVDCVRIAGVRAGERSQGSVLASDAFFPFPDGVQEAAALGVEAIVQPGGSVRDALAIEAADEAGIVMIFTGVRHFRH